MPCANISSTLLAEMPSHVFTSAGGSMNRWSAAQVAAATLQPDFATAATPGYRIDYHSAIDRQR
jgi:hypothetical protein